MRSNNEVLAMSQRERVKLQFKKFFSMRSATEGDTRNDVEENNPPQYRLEAPRRKRTGLFCCKGAVGTRGLSDIKPNEQLASWLHWTFRSNFLILIFVMSLLFFTFIYIFAGIIFGAGRMNSECVRVGTWLNRRKQLPFTTKTAEIGANIHAFSSLMIVQVVKLQHRFLIPLH